MRFVRCLLVKCDVAKGKHAMFPGLSLPQWSAQVREPGSTTSVVECFSGTRSASTKAVHRSSLRSTAAYLSFARRSRKHFGSLLRRLCYPPSFQVSEATYMSEAHWNLQMLNGPWDHQMKSRHQDYSPLAPGDLECSSRWLAVYQIANHLFS